MEQVSDFYENETRRDSRELRFGSQWRSSEHPGLVFHVFWVAAEDNDGRIDPTPAKRYFSTKSIPPFSMILFQRFTPFSQASTARGR